MKKNSFLLLSTLLCVFLSTRVNAGNVASRLTELYSESMATDLDIISSDTILKKVMPSEEIIVAQRWSPETDLPGLGIADIGISNQAFTVLCKDGVTTLGLFYDGDLVVTGINTTANEVYFPDSIKIDGIVKSIDYFGLHGSIDWSGATSLTKLHTSTVKEIYEDFSNSNITDIYIYDYCNFINNNALSNIYLHIPFGFNRNEYEWYGFNRILVGDEKPEYPAPSYSEWFVIAGENEGEYFSVYDTDGTFCIAEIFTSNDTITLPSEFSINNVKQYFGSFGCEQYYTSGSSCINAPNLKHVIVPSCYNSINIKWSYSPITDLYLQGDVPSTYWSLNSNINVYATQPFYSNYIGNYDWSKANILPYGWDFEWITVNVGRKGEFAQTYIEMTDANWNIGFYVKVTGSLNESDLENIKNLENLKKLDLSEAKFSELPSSFLSGRTFLTEVVLPDSLTSISSSAFNGCYNLQKIVASGVKSVGDYAFYNCSKLNEFDISNVTFIDNSAFYGCTVFNPAKLSPDLEFLGAGAFRKSGITEVTVPENITYLNSYLFEQCTQLQKITLPNTITSIGDDAFNGCSNLVGIDLHEGITSIGDGAFNQCSKITEITLPSTLQSIGYNMFDNCTALVTVKCKAIVPPVTNGEFTYNVDLNHCVLYIAPFAIDAYRATEYWDDFYIMKALNEPVKNIYINRPMTFDLLSEDNAVLKENPNMTLDYNSYNSVGQLSASGDGTLSAGVFSIYHKFNRRTNSSSDYRTTLINNAENMRADSVVCLINFEKNNWHFISFQYDVKMEDISGLNNTDFVIRRYNSANRASGDGIESNWEDVPADGVLEAGKGYIIQTANNSTDENGYSQLATVCFPSRNTVTKNNLFTSKNAIVPLEEFPAEFAHNRSWNLVGNPYPCYYDMHYLMDDFSTPIVLWRGTSYQAYSPIDDDIILRPNEAFFVQRPLETEQMVFGVEGRMHYDEANNADATPGVRTTSAIAGTTADRNVFNFNIEGCGNNDRTRIVMNEKASLDYEIDCDASKFFASVSEGVEIYVDGAVKYDICERPFADGTASLGLRTAKTGKYTISLTGRYADGWIVMLQDKQTGSLVDLTEGSYIFDAESGTSQARFAITFKAPETTSIDGIIPSGDNANVRVVNTAGITVYEGNIADFKSTANAGVYLVIDSGRTYKIIIK